VNKLKFGIPKGSLEKATTDLFAKAGWMIKTSSRNYFPTVDDPHLSCAIIRAQEMAHYVEEGVLDAAITGKDWILENGSDVVEVQEMIYSKESPRPARWVLVVTEDSPIQRIEDLQGKKIATELVSFTKRYFAERGIQVKVEFSWGTTEAKVVEGLVDAIVDVTETGSTIRAHHLRVVHELMQSTPRLIANKEAWQDPWKKEKIQQIATLLKAALGADRPQGPHRRFLVPERLVLRGGRGPGRSGAGTHPPASEKGCGGHRRVCLEQSHLISSPGRRKLTSP
jgi:ATP phosphoribosyltransferase